MAVWRRWGAADRRGDAFHGFHLRVDRTALQDAASVDASRLPGATALRHTARSTLEQKAPPRRCVPQVGGCYVYGAEGPVKGICHFVGGAFAGAVPQALYPVFLRDLAENGYTVVATPFPVSFRHMDCAERLQQKFRQTLETLRTSPIAEKVPDDAPLHGIGHSFGALAHSLIGCTGTTDLASNVLISFNNKPVAEAIPIPGFLPAVTAAFDAYDRSPVKLLPDPVSTAKEVAKVLLPPVPDPTVGISRRVVEDGLDQLQSVFREIRDGVVDFEPRPEESARIIEQRYGVKETLLVRFADDGIDETPSLRELMAAPPEQSTTFLTLKGSHATPCVGDARWLTTIANAEDSEEIVENILRDAVADTRAFVRRVVEWLDAK